MRRLPPLGSIQAFVQVARLGSLKAAADSLALSPPALTRRIQSLEQVIGGPLLLRQSNTVQLNDRGEQFLAEIGPHLDGLAAAFETISRPSGLKRIRIAVPSLFASQRLMPALPSLLSRHPDLSIDVDTGANRITRLEDGLDIAIAVAESVDDKKYYTRMIERGRVIALGSPRLATSNPAISEPRDLERAHILIHREMPRAFEEWRKSLGLPDLEPAGTNYYDAGQLILDAAAEGLGIAFMLESHLVHSDKSRLTQYFGHAADSPYAYWFVCSPASLRHRPVKQFHDWLFDQFEGPGPTGKQ